VFVNSLANRVAYTVLSTKKHGQQKFRGIG
jgi:hypothetical protein